MSFNGSGTFLINTAGQPVVSGTVISSTAFNALTADLATGLSTAITKDGQTTVTANIPMSTYKFTGLGVGSAATDSANLSQVQSTVTKLLNSVSGADTITATASPTLAAYAAGQMFYFVAAGDNTTSVTLNIDSLGAKAVTRDGATALAAADIKSGEVVVVVYDGTRFQVVSQLNSAGDARFANVSIASSLYVGGVSTFVGNAGFSANVSIASALSVGGVAAITGATTIGGNLTLSAGTASGVLYLNGSKVATSGSGLYTDGSRLGIGTVSFPAGQRLRVAGGDVGFEGQYFYLLNADANIQMGAAQNAQIINSDSGNLLTISRTGASSAMAFSTAGSEAMRITNAQNVGIGTASPAYRLQVETASATGNIVGYFRQGSGAVASIISTTDLVGFGNGATAGETRIYADGSSGLVTFRTNSTERMRLDSSGNLGIGTASPSALGLQVTKGSGVAAGLLISNAANNWSISCGASTNALIFTDNQFAERARITSGGEFLLGTTTAGDGFFRLSASANAYNIIKIDDTGSTGGNYIQFLNSAGNQAGSINHNGTTTVNYGSGSDYRLKENIAPMTGALAKVALLKPCTFTWKTDGTNGQGFIAHELQEVVPDAVVGKKDEVNEDGSIKTQTVDTSFLVATLTAAIQEQQVMINELKAKVAALEAK